MKFVKMRDRYVNADKILFIDGVDSTLADLCKPAYFYYWLKLEGDIYIQSDNFTTKEQAELDMAMLVNQLENK